MDLEPLGTLAKVLSERQTALDIISLHTSVLEIVEDSLGFLDEYDLDVVGKTIRLHFFLAEVC